LAVKSAYFHLGSNKAELPLIASMDSQPVNNRLAIKLFVVKPRGHEKRSMIRSLGALRWTYPRF